MRMSFDPMTIEHLGIKMYSRLPNAVAELVANSYDADAHRVEVQVGSAAGGNVVVSDDGHGMSRDDLADKYLRIGRNRVKDGDKFSEGGRRVAGKKGLGKLALFGIGSRVSVRTKRKGAPVGIEIVLDWDKMLVAGGNYEPAESEYAADPHDHGTDVTISQLKRKTKVNPLELANSLARLFNHSDDDFALVVTDGMGPELGVDRDRRYKAFAEEGHWKVPEDFGDALQSPVGKKLKGVVFASQKPLPADLRGVAIYVNGRLANEGEFYGVPESSQSMSYITGYVDADFIDDMEEDVISTDRRSLSWGNPALDDFHEDMERLIREAAVFRRKLRGPARKREVKRNLGVDVDAWPDTIRSSNERSGTRQVLNALVSPDSTISDDDAKEIGLIRFGSVVGV